MVVVGGGLAGLVTARALATAGVDVTVQRSTQRIFDDSEFERAGAQLADTLEACPLIIGLKEVPADRLFENKVHAFFSHTIKGQPKNMPMLLHLMERGCTLIDYEKITDDAGRRLVFFGLYAGIAGMIDTLWALGRRLEHEGVNSPLSKLRSGHEYATIEEATADIERVGAELWKTALPERFTPLVIGVTGNGNAAQGALRVLARLGARSLHPSTIGQLPGGPGVYQVNFRTRDLVEPRLGLPDLSDFDQDEYFRRPGRYRGVFERFLPYLNVLVNCIYWDDRYPRLVTLEGLRALFDDPRPPRLTVIGDISCDVRGAIEATVRSTTPDSPVYVYDIETGAAPSGVEGRGPVILAVYNLPSEFPREASVAFGDALLPFIEPMASADYSTTFEKLALPDPLRRAVIVYRGELTPAFAYLEEHL